MIERILGIILPVFSVIAVGYLWGRRVKPDMAVVNRISMNVLSPALIFSALSSKSFDVRGDAMLMVGASAWCWARACSRGRSRAGSGRMPARSCRR